MDERALQFRVGFMVAAALISTAILVALFGNVPSLSRHQDHLSALSRGPGATTDTPVAKAASSSAG